MRKGSRFKPALINSRRHAPSWPAREAMALAPPTRGGWKVRHARRPWYVRGPLAVEWGLEWFYHRLRGLALFDLLELAGRCTVLVIAIFWLLEADDRTKERHYRAWELINSARGSTGDGGRKDALQDLNRDGVSLAAAPLEKAHLPKVDLKDAYLEGANLKGANLTDANLQSANLTGAGLRGAFLMGANLEDANLMTANLEGAILMSANLKNAYLCSPFSSASRRAAPSRASSASDRKRSSERSGYFSTCRQGFHPSGRMPHFSARLNILESSARQRLAAPGFAFMLW